MWNPFRTTNKESHVVSHNSSSNLNDNATTIKDFIEEEPNGLYIIDGQKGDSNSIICRVKPEGGKT